MPDETVAPLPRGGEVDTAAYLGANIGRAFKHHDADSVDRVLWEVAVTGGNVAKALRNLREADLENGVDGELPDQATARRWLRGRFRNRYHEIVQQRMPAIDKQLQASYAERLIGLDAMEQDVTRHILGRLANLDGVEAAKVLQAVAMAKKVNMDGMMQIRRGEQAATDGRSIMELAGAIRNLGVATISKPADVTLASDQVSEVKEEETPPPSASPY